MYSFLSAGIGIAFLCIGKAFSSINQIKEQLRLQKECQNAMAAQIAILEYLKAEEIVSKE